jgi:hypothetical protein
VSFPQEDGEDVISNDDDDDDDSIFLVLENILLEVWCKSRILSVKVDGEKSAIPTATDDKARIEKSIRL